MPSILIVTFYRCLSYLMFQRLVPGRISYCKIYKAYVKGFDYHFPTFGNCIGQPNDDVFPVFLVALITTGVSYASCSYLCK
uniref:S-acyltransferase n=1 Tax=Kalanchoe fedtschenkoi TaxID=63787 RepID=A0A7N0UKI3_KALFE